MRGESLSRRIERLVSDHRTQTWASQVTHPARSEAWLDLYDRTRACLDLEGAGSPG